MFFPSLAGPAPAEVDFRLGFGSSFDGAEAL
jgi:hypothetical protein